MSSNTRWSNKLFLTLIAIALIFYTCMFFMYMIFQPFLSSSLIITLVTFKSYSLMVHLNMLSKTVPPQELFLAVIALPLAIMFQFNMF